MPLIDSLSTTEALEELFSDGSVLQAMLDFEIALARAAARAGAIPAKAAEIIAATPAEAFDAASIARAARRSATPAVPFVDALRRQVRSRDAASATYVHWGATSQDVTDSALVLLLERAKTPLERDHLRLQDALRTLSDRHAGDVMLGRTLLQPAPPITFGLKAARWYAAARAAWGRLETALQDACVLQFGGASGTLAALGDRAEAVAEGLARELDLRPAPPWHADRVHLAAFAAACGLYSAALAKIARDIALLMQAEVREVAEPGGGSSSMPHKRNPAACTIALAAAGRIPGLVAASLASVAQEHERAIGGSQGDWATIAAIVQGTGAALAALAEAVEGLAVDPARMRGNFDATRGVVFAERAMALLAPRVGRDVAQQLVDAALERTNRTGTPFGEALAQIPEVQRVLTAEEVGSIGVPEEYLGRAEAFRKRLLQDG